MSAGNKEMKSSSKAGTEPLKSFFDLFFFLMTGAELEGNLRQAQSNFLKQPQLYGTRKKEVKSGNGSFASYLWIISIDMNLFLIYYSHSSAFHVKVSSSLQ